MAMARTFSDDSACSSGFVDEIMFAHNWQNTDTDLKCAMQQITYRDLPRSTAKLCTWGIVCYLRLSRYINQYTMEMVQIELLRTLASSPHFNSTSSVSKEMWAVKLHSNKILQFLTSNAGYCRLACVVAVKWLLLLCYLKTPPCTIVRCGMGNQYLPECIDAKGRYG